MRRRSFASPASIAFAIGFSLAVVSPAHADAFNGFRIPDNHAFLWTGSFGGSASWGDYDSPTGTDRSGSERGSLTTSLRRLDDADAGTLSFALALGLDGARGHDARTDYLGVPPVATRDDEVTARDRHQSVHADALRSWFATARPVFVALSASAGGDYLQDSDVSSATTTYSLGTVTSASEHGAWSVNQQFIGAASVGVGRVRNATGVYEARVLEDRLLASGALSRPLGAEARRALAALLYARDDVATAKQRPAAIVWRAVERILRDDGALREGGAGAGEWLRLAEPWIGGMAFTDAIGLPRSPIARAIGWSLAAAFREKTSYSLDRTRDRSVTNDPGAPPLVQESHDRHPYSTDMTQAGLTAEFHRPIGLRRQLDAAGACFLPLRSQSTGLSASTSATVQEVIADRWLASVSASHLRTIDREPGGFTRIDAWRWQLTAQCQYFVTDRVSVTASASQGDRYARSDSVDGAPGQQRRNRSGGITLGLDYRFAGFADVPGVRPAP